MKVEELIKKLTPQQKALFKGHFVRCEFDDECDSCENPTHGSYAVGYDNYTCEVDEYLCGECAINYIPKLEDHHKRLNEDFK